MRQKSAVVATALIALLACASLSEAGTRPYSATLQGGQEVPAVISTRTGTASLIVNPVLTGLPNVRFPSFEIVVFLAGVTPAEITGFHLHQGVAGVNGPIILDFLARGGSFVSVPGGSRLAMTGVPAPIIELDDFLNGRTYVNVHTTFAPAGELRGQVVEGALGAPKVLTADLDGSQETPPVSTAARGRAALTYDRLAADLPELPEPFAGEQRYDVDWAVDRRDLLNWVK